MPRQADAGVGLIKVGRDLAAVYLSGLCRVVGSRSHQGRYLARQVPVHEGGERRIKQPPYDSGIRNGLRCLLDLAATGFAATAASIGKTTPGAAGPPDISASARLMSSEQESAGSARAPTRRARSHAQTRNAATSRSARWRNRAAARYAVPAATARSRPTPSRRSNSRSLKRARAAGWFYAIGDVTPQGDHIRKHFGDARRPGEVLGMSARTQSPGQGLPAVIQPEVIARGQDRRSRTRGVSGTDCNPVAWARR